MLVREGYEFLRTYLERDIIHLPPFHLENVLGIRRLSRLLHLCDRSSALTLRPDVLQALKVQRICGLYVSSDVDHK